MANKIDPKIGDRLIMPPTRYHAQKEYAVVRVARIKFDVTRAEDFERYQETGRGYVQTFRKDTACEDGTNGYSAPRLYTPEGWALELREDAVREYLKSIGIETYRLKTDVITPLTLANLIRKHLGEEEI